jgi:glycosyltransferase involved in cell wall biosynthesis
MPKLSIIIPVYYNELNLPDTFEELLNLGKKLDQHNLEIVFVDDGSGDRSFEVLLSFQQSHPEIAKVVKLTRNFGSMSAIQAGFSIATGDCVGVIAADLQDPPELFLEMLEHWQNGIKAVFAVRRDREESFLQKLFSNSFYFLMKKLAIPNYPPGGFDFLLIDRQIVDEINKMQEKNTNIFSLVFWLGFPHVLVPYVRKKREKGKSRWTLSKKIKLFIDSFVAFSFVPIRFLSFAGIIVALLSFVYGFFVFMAWLNFGVEVKGYVPTMLILSFASGLQMTMLGVLGEYLWRTLDEIRHRPPYVIDRIYTGEDK